MRKRSSGGALRDSPSPPHSTFARLPSDPSVYTSPYVEPPAFEAAWRQVVDLALQVNRQLK